MLTAPTDLTPFLMARGPLPNGLPKSADGWEYPAGLAPMGFHAEDARRVRDSMRPFYRS